LSVISFTFFIFFLSSLMSLLFHTSLHFVKCRLLLVITMLLVEIRTLLLVDTASAYSLYKSDNCKEIVPANFSCVLAPTPASFETLGCANDCAVW